MEMGRDGDEEREMGGRRWRGGMGRGRWREGDEERVREKKGEGDGER